MAIQTRTLEYQHGDVILEALMVFDDSSLPKPGVLISHAWGGRDGLAESKARHMAELGYVGFALDMYGKGVRGTTKEECAALMTPLMEDRELLQKRVNLALETLKLQAEVQAEKIAAIGFCFGGLCVLDLARSGAELNSVVSFHGLLSRPDNLASQDIKASVLVLNGHIDPMVSAEDIQQLQNDLESSKCDWQLHNFGRTMHAFSNPDANDPDFGTVYSAVADQRAWQMTQAFLGETLC